MLGVGIEAPSGVEPAALLEWLVQELGVRYVDANDRYVAMLVVGYREGEVSGAAQAAACAAELVKNWALGGSTRWVVLDRMTGRIEEVRQDGAVVALPNHIDVGADVPGGGAV